MNLTPNELALLSTGLLEWSGPASCTDRMAIGLGFISGSQMARQCRDLAASIEASPNLTAADWLRAILATEIAFASDAVGSGYEWSTTTGMTDEETIRTLRKLQRKLAPIVSPIARP